jgi:hypothetical protein
MGAGPRRLAPRVRGLPGASFAVSAMLLGALVGALLLLHLAPVAPLVLAVALLAVVADAARRPAQRSGNRWRVALHAGPEGGVPAADPATVRNCRAGEGQRGSVWIRAGPDVVPVKDELAERLVPACIRG